MKALCLLPIIFLLSTCLSGDKPVAKITYSKVEVAKQKYSITFRSDQNIDALFRQDQGESVVTKRLVCALGNDRDFRVEHNMDRFFEGDVLLQQKEAEVKYRYLSPGFFVASWDEGARRRFMESEEVLESLADKSEIECKIVMTIYFSRPYFSESMMIPAEAIREVVRRADPPLPCCETEKMLKEVK